MKFTPEVVEKFISTLAETGIVMRAIEAAGITRPTAYNWRTEHPEFAEAWDRAVKIGITALEDEAHRRAFEGVEKALYHRGEKVDVIREYSDTLAIFLLKAHNPEKYRDNASLQLSGPNNGPIEVDTVERAERISALLSAAKERKLSSE